ncbi:MAG: hypothetical protein GX620_15455 [Chloroflexi bacterium]|nr:hypothetical protein [Chloroflexota bacterium]
MRMESPEWVLDHLVFDEQGRLAPFPIWSRAGWIRAAICIPAGWDRRG